MVTKIARDMVTRWGMSPALGPLQVESPDSTRPLAAQPLSESTLRLVDREIHNLVESADGQARRLVEKHRAALGRLAEALLADESLDGEKAREIVSSNPSQTCLVPAAAIAS